MINIVTQNMFFVNSYTQRFAICRFLTVADNILFEFYDQWIKYAQKRLIHFVYSAVFCIL